MAIPFFPTGKSYYSFSREYTWSVNSFHSEESVDPRLGDKSRSGILVGSPLGRVENIAHGKGGGGERSGLPSEALTDP